MKKSLLIILIALSFPVHAQNISILAVIRIKSPEEIADDIREDLSG